MTTLTLLTGLGPTTLTAFLLTAGAIVAPRNHATQGEAPPAVPTFVAVPNLDDDDGDGKPDGQDLVVNGERDVEDLVAIPPAPAMRGGFKTMTLAFAGGDPGNARAFVKLDGAWRAVDTTKGEVIDLEKFRASGSALAVEVLDFAKGPAGAELKLVAEFDSSGDGDLTRTTYTIHVAPFLLVSALEPAKTVHVAKTPLTEKFVADLAPLVKGARAELRAFEHADLAPNDVWMQDACEIGYAENGNTWLSASLRGNRGKPLDKLFAQAFLGPNRGTVARGEPRADSEWIDWYGNLEVTPPLTVGGRAFPEGLVYCGDQGARRMHPEVVKFLEAQRFPGEAKPAQGPVLWLDTSWLVIGHVDEVLSWVQSGVGTPYRALLPSPRLAVELLTKAEMDAPGGVLNRGTKRDQDKPNEFERPVAAALADKSLLDEQQHFQKKIDALRATLKRELGVKDEDFVELPVLFHVSMKSYAGRAVAETPNLVNGLLVNGTYIVPDPHGPLVDGKDVFLEDVKRKLEPLGVAVKAIDDFHPYHRWLGDVHCATNATRRPFQGKK